MFANLNLVGKVPVVKERLMSLANTGEITLEAALRSHVERMSRAEDFGVVRQSRSDTSPALTGSRSLNQVVEGSRFIWDRPVAIYAARILISTSLLAKKSLHLLLLSRSMSNWRSRRSKRAFNAGAFQALLALIPLFITCGLTKS